MIPMVKVILKQGSRRIGPWSPINLELGPRPNCPLFIALNCKAAAEIQQEIVFKLFHIFFTFPSVKSEWLYRKKARLPILKTEKRCRLGKHWTLQFKERQLSIKIGLVVVYMCRQTRHFAFMAEGYAGD